LRRHLNGESDGREDVEAPIMRDPVPEWEKRILCTVEHPRAAQISKKMQSACDPAVAEFRWFAGQKGPWRLWVTWRRAFVGGWPVRAEDDKNRPKPVADREVFPHHLSPRDDQKGEMLKPQRHRRERLQWEPNRAVWTHQEDVRCWMQVRVIGRMSPGQSHPQGGRGVSQNQGPTKISAEPRPESWHQM
jgi:hypothetical protein